MILKRNAQQLIFTTTVIAMKDKEEKKPTTVNPFTKAETGIQENSNQVFETLQFTQKSTVL